MRLIYLVALVLVCGCKMRQEVPGSKLEGTAVHSRYLLWPSPEISICWEPSRFTKLYDDARRLIETEYNQRTVIKFVGFVPCNDEQSFDIRIEFLLGGFGSHTADSIWAGRVKTSGQHLRNVPSGLQVKISPGESARKLSSGDRHTLLHELGHALGLMHEHGHADSDCKAPFADTGRQVDVAPYDKDSIMNYCDYSETLSAGDIATINGLYTGKIILPDLDRVSECQDGGGEWIWQPPWGDVPCCKAEQKITHVPRCPSSPKTEMAKPANENAAKSSYRYYYDHTWPRDNKWFTGYSAADARWQCLEYADDNQLNPMNCLLSN